MTFTSEAARELHTGTDHVARFVETIYPLCVEPPRSRDITSVASSPDPTIA